MMQSEWLEMVRREGTVDGPVGMGAGALESSDGEPACPACGTVAPLSGGACSDCGLQLE